MAAWGTHHLTEARQAMRVVVAALVAVGITHVLRLPQSYWAVLTAVIVVQASVGASIRAAIDRFMGSLVGAVVGAALAAFLPLHESWGLVVGLLIAIPPTAWLAARKPRYRMAPITAAIVLLTATGDRHTILTLAFERVAEILVGNVIGVVVALVVFPARAHAAVADSAARVILIGAELLDLQLGDSIDDQREDLLYVQMRAGITALEAASDEARLERKSRLTDEQDAEPLVRAVRRLRNDLVMIGRAAAQAAPVPQLAETRKALREIARSLIQSLVESLRTRTTPPPLVDMLTRLRAYAVETERLRSTDGLTAMDGPQIARLYAMGFSLEQLALDLDQLRERIAELADNAAAPTSRASKPSGNRSSLSGEALRASGAEERGERDAR